LSAEKKRFFPDRRSAIVSITVIVVLLLLAMLLLYRSDSARSRRCLALAEDLRGEAVVAMEERFSCAGELADLIEDPVLSARLEEAANDFDPTWPVPRLSESYDRLEDVLASIEKPLYLQENSLICKACYTKLYEAESKLKPAVEAYNAQAAYCGRLLASFPARLAATRLGLAEPREFSLSRALKGRP
jgi:exonuclease VII small subunit